MGEVWNDIFLLIFRALPWGLVMYLLLSKQWDKTSMFSELKKQQKHIDEEMTKLDCTRLVVQQQIEIMKLKAEELRQREKALGMMEEMLGQVMKSEDDLVGYLDNRDVA